MCRLYTDLTTAESIRALKRDFGQLSLYDYDTKQPSLRPWRIATTDQARVIRRDKEDQWRVDLMRWGLVPHWAKDLKIGINCVNARSETIVTTAAFRDAFQRQRCLVPASGWVEWREEDVPGERKPVKQPYRIELGNGQPILFAGLWASWRPKGADEPPVLSYAIATCEPSAWVARIHDRMPVLLDPDDAEAWLVAPANEALALLKPYAGTLVARPIHRDIANHKVATRASIEPIGPALAA
jgi:putative SOS response-associated peptidase YedK